MCHLCSVLFAKANNKASLESPLNENVMSEGREVRRDGIIFTGNPPHLSSGKLSRELSEGLGNEQSCCRGVGNSSDCMGGKMTTWPWTTISFDLLKGQRQLKGWDSIWAKTGCAC